MQDDRLTLLDVFTIGLFLVVFGVLGVVSYSSKLIKGGNMKKILLGLLILFTFALSGSVLSETFTWTNPTAYVDGSAIPSAKQAQIKTHLFWGTSASGPWTEFAVVIGGVASYVGVPPPERGVMAYYTMTAELDSIQSAYMLPATSYTRPFVACNPGSNLVIK